MTRLRATALALTAVATVAFSAGPVADAAATTGCSSGNRPSSPTLRAAAFGDGVRVTWDRVPDADGYEVRYSWSGIGPDGTPYTGPANSQWQPAADPDEGVTVTAPADAGRVSVEVAASNGCGRSDSTRWEGPRSSPQRPAASRLSPVGRA